MLRVLDMLQFNLRLPVFIGFFLISSLSVAFNIDSMNAIDGVTARADSFEVIGDNMVAYGNIFVRKGDLIVNADKAVFNNTNKLLELSGNVRFYKMVRSRQEIEYWELQKLEKDPNVKIKVVGTVMNPTGRQKLVVDTIRETLSWQGDEAIGNLNTGVFQLGKFQTNIGGWTIAADGAVRKADGQLEISNAQLSPCPDYMEGHSVYSMKSGTVDAFPSGDQPSNIKGLDTSSATNINAYHFWAYNNILYIGELPVLWIPVFYKPPRQDLGNWSFTGGSGTAYGTYFKSTNNWTLSDTPDLMIGTSNMLDYFSKRGLGFGNATTVTTPTSKTETFAYMINDNDANYSLPNPNPPRYLGSRYSPLNPTRYDVDIKNMTHITDRLDFRGRFNSLSDLYFLNDYYSSWFYTDPEPATYTNASYQFDRAALDLTFRPQINKWSPTVEQLPTLTLTVPRQELWNNFYYQGQSSAGWYDMQWGQFRNSRASMGLGNGVEPANYNAARFDTVHFLYYPLNLKEFNLIPRAGFRFTGYSNSSSVAISDQQLNNNLSVETPEQNSTATVVNYDNKGGAAGRFIPEFGLNLNTKASRSWDGIKNGFWDINGIRHVTQPYIDYTYLTPMGTDRKYIYYFDDIDRIDTQNFMRYGLDNRLQTRRGGWKSSQSYTWASMSNYLDVLFNTDSRTNEPSGTIKNIGDFGNIINITPTEDLAFNLTALIDGGRLFSGNGLNNCVSTAHIGTTWTFADGWSINPSWSYTSNNNTNPTYSMGNMMEQIESGTFFQRTFTDTSYMTTNLNFKINDRTRGVFSVSRDFQNTMWPNAGISLTRDLPCSLQLIVGASIAQSYNNNPSGGTQTNNNLSATLQFTSTPTYEITPRESTLPNDALEEPFVY